MKEKGKTKRLLDCWISGFLNYTNKMPSPTIFKKWAGISCIAGALGRKVWTVTMGQPTYPNLYIMLIAPPGVGKSVAIAETERLWRRNPAMYTAPSSLTKAALIDQLALSSHKHAYKDKIKLCHELALAASEFGVLCPFNDLEFFNTLNVFYDCEDRYEEKRRSIKDPIIIDNPQLNILAGTQPGFLGELLTDQSFEMGFPSRVCFVYSSEQITSSLFDHNVLNETLYEQLERDLEKISMLKGEIVWTDEAKKAMEHWHLVESKETAVMEPKFQNYNARRVRTVIKLCMIESIMKSDTLVIEKTDFNTVLDNLYEMEYYIPEIIKGLRVNPHFEIIDECWNMLMKSYSATKSPVPEQKILYYLARRVPSNMVRYIIDSMENAGIIAIAGKQKDPQSKAGAPNGKRYFIPLSKEQHGEFDNAKLI